MIDSLVEKHTRVLKTMDSLDSVYQGYNLIQIISTFGLFVVVTLQIRLAFSLFAVGTMIIAASQLFLYCAISEYLSMRVSGGRICQDLNWLLFMLSSNSFTSHFTARNGTNLRAFHRERKYCWCWRSRRKGNAIQRDESFQSTWTLFQTSLIRPTHS